MPRETTAVCPAAWCTGRLGGGRNFKKHDHGIAELVFVRGSLLFNFLV